jgi:signal transduction histidine kinase
VYADVAPVADAPADAARYRQSVRPRQSVEPEDRERRAHPNRFDLALTVVAVVLAVVIQLRGESDDAFRDPDALSLFLALAITVPLYWRRRFPLPALLVSTAAICVLNVLDYRSDLLPVAVVFLTYAAAAYEPLRRAVVGLVAVNVAILLVWLLGAPEFDVASATYNAALFTATWFAGSAVRSRAAAVAARVAEADERAEAQRQQAARSVAEERLRIAQELHDVVAHSMSVIAVQAGMGVHVIDQQPAEAKQALEAISRTSRSTLHEMRRLLGVLRGDEGERVHVPAPGLGDLPALVEQVRSTGLPVDLVVDGDTTDVPLGVDLSVYRVVQEGLTNVIKHAGPATAVVTVRYAPGEVVVGVSDDGRGAAAAAPSENGGHGLAGMRERVAVWGGTLEAGPVPGGGYRVVAHLPYGDPS